MELVCSLRARLSRRRHLSIDSHFEHGHLKGSSERFFVKLGHLKREPGHGLNEAVRAAHQINSARRGLPIQLCVSGGVDSEAMLRSFLTAKVPFEAVLMRFKNNLNFFDIETNLEFCKSRSIPYQIVELDIIQFLESGAYLEYGEKYRCQSPQLAAHLWLLDQLDGLPVFGGNPIAPVWMGNQWYFVGLPGDLHCVYFRYFEIKKRLGVPWFFLYSPELAASFIKTQAIKPFLNKQSISPDSYTYAIKCQSYQNAGFDVLPRDEAYTGFELVREYYDEIDGTRFGVAFDKRFREVLQNKNPLPLAYSQYVPSSYIEGLDS